MATDFGATASLVIGLGVAGHAIVGIVLTSPLRDLTDRLWSRFGDDQDLLRLNGLLLFVAAGLHLVFSAGKTVGDPALVILASTLPFPFFMAAGWLERANRTGGWHIICMLAGFAAFAWHGLLR